MTDKRQVANPESRLITQKEAADRIGKPVSWLHHRADELGIPRYRIGNHWRYRVSELDEWINQQAVTA